MRVLGVVNAMVCARGIEMASGSGEGGAITLANVVNVDAVLTGSKLGTVTEILTPSEAAENSAWPMVAPCALTMSA